jgi:hypothetical protein
LQISDGKQCMLRQDDIDAVDSGLADDEDGESDYLPDK